jgi:MFS family permease
MSEAEGNGKSFERIDDLEEAYETNMWKRLAKAAQNVQDDGERQLAQYVFDSSSVEEVAAKLQRIKRGSWLDNLLLAGAAVGGLVAGHAAQRWVDLRRGRIPVTGLLGLGPIAAGAAMNRSLTARNVVGLGGALFLAGAGLYTSSHPLGEGSEEE